MAPSSLNQVFVANAATTPGLVAGAFSQPAASGSAANSKFGIWDLSAASGAGAYLTGASATTSLMSTAGVLNTSLKSIQVTQTMLNGNCIASPIIDASSIKRIAITKHQATKLHQIQINLASFAATNDIDDSIMFRIALRSAPTSYISYTNPGDTTLDLSATATAINGVVASSVLYPFPLIGNFSTGRMIFNVEVTEQALIAAGGVSIANVRAEFAKAFASDKMLGKLFTVDTSTVADSIIVTARHAGVVFDMTVQSNNAAITSSDVTVYQASDEGSGNSWQVISEEKSQRARYGNFNRMYFPTAFPEFTLNGNTYDAFEISYEHSHPASTGIARPAELNIVRVYVPSAVFGLTNVDSILANTDTTVQGALAVGVGVTEWYF
jgi:hypothetical protein